MPLSSVESLLCSRHCFRHESIKAWSRLLLTSTGKDECQLTDGKPKAPGRINNSPQFTQLVMDSSRNCRLFFRFKFTHTLLYFQTLGWKRFLNAVRIKTKNLWHDLQRLARHFLSLSLSLTLQTNPDSWHSGPKVLTTSVHYLQASKQLL